MIKPSKYSVLVEKNIKVTPNNNLITLKINNEDRFEFIPGQFINIFIGDGKFRSYSIVSKNTITNTFDLIISTNKPGRGSDYIKKLVPGDEITFIGPSGRFTLKKPLPKEIYFFATGVGIAPFISMFYELVKNRYQGKVRFFHGIRYENEIIYEKELNEINNNLRNFKYEVWCSQPKEEYSLKGRITIPLQNIEFNNEREIYICGNEDMTKEVKDALINNGYNNEKIYSEEF